MWSCWCFTTETPTLGNISKYIRFVYLRVQSIESRGTSLCYIGSSRSVKVTYNKTCLKEDKTNKQTNQKWFHTYQRPQLVTSLLCSTYHSLIGCLKVVITMQAWHPDRKQEEGKKGRKSQQLGFHCKQLPWKSTPLLTYVFIGWDIKSLTTASNKKEYGYNIWLPRIKASSFGEEEERWKTVMSHYVVI